MDHHSELIQTFEEFIERSKTQPVRLGDVLERIRDDGFSLICLVHTLPFLQPLSLGPISTAAGVSLMALGGQMTTGKHTPWLPRRMAEITLSPKMWRILLVTCEKVLSFCRKLARPRLSVLARGELARRIGGIIIMLGGLLLAVPLAGVPFSNTLPALAVLFVCIAELEEDGLFMLAAMLFLVFTVIYFGFLGWAALSAADFAWNWFQREE